MLSLPVLFQTAALIAETLAESSPHVLCLEDSPARGPTAVWPPGVDQRSDHAHGMVAGQDTSSSRGNVAGEWIDF